MIEASAKPTFPGHVHRRGRLPPPARPSRPRRWRRCCGPPCRGGWSSSGSRRSSSAGQALADGDTAREGAPALGRADRAGRDASRRLADRWFTDNHYVRDPPRDDASTAFSRSRRWRRSPPPGSCYSADERITVDDLELGVGFPRHVATTGSGDGPGARGGRFFLVVAPGVVAGLAPWLLTGWHARETPLALPALGGFLVGAGTAVLLNAFVRFVVEGIGTPAPVAPTERLVVGGLYRHVRNPMPLAVAAVIVGQALVPHGPFLLVYAAAFAARRLAVRPLVRGADPRPALRRGLRGVPPGGTGLGRPRLRPRRPGVPD